MNYKQLKKQLKNQTELYKACLSEFEFEKLQNDFYQSNLKEIKSLLEMKASNKLILRVIDNFIERQFLDKLIRAEIMFK